MNGRGDRKQGWEGQGSAQRNSREYQFLRVENADFLKEMSQERLKEK